MNKDERLRQGYSGAISMANTEAGVIWSAYRTILSVNAFLAVFIGAVTTLRPVSSWFGSVFASVGMLVCIAWYFTLSRQFGYFRYWIAWARHLEEQGLKPEVQMLSLGKTYGEGGSVSLSGSDIRLSWTGRAFKIQLLLSLLIGVFFFLYLALLLFSLCVFGPEIADHPTTG